MKTDMCETAGTDTGVAECVEKCMRFYQTKDYGNGKERKMHVEITR